jgi:preprotein translocase subunit Sss1
MKKGERSTLAATLNTDSTTISELSKIDAGQIQKLYTQNNPNGFIVRVLVKDTGVLDELEKGIVHGLESSTYVVERVASRRGNLKAMIEKVKIELSKLDSMKTSIQQMITSRRPGGSSFMLDVSGLNAQWIGLNEKLLALQDELKFVNAVQVLQSFNKISKPESPKLLKTLFFGVLAGGFIGYVIAMIRYLLLKLKARSNERN